MRQDLIGHIPAFGPQVLDGQLVILCRPGDHCVGQNGEVPRLFSLVRQVRLGDRALLGVVQVTAQRAQRFALVQLPGDLPAVPDPTGTSRRESYAAPCLTPSTRPPGCPVPMRPTASRRPATRWPDRISATRPSAAGQVSTTRNEEILNPRPPMRLPGHGSMCEIRTVVMTVKLFGPDEAPPQAGHPATAVSAQIQPPGRGNAEVSASRISPSPKRGPSEPVNSH